VSANRELLFQLNIPASHYAVAQTLLTADSLPKEVPIDVLSMYQASVPAVSPNVEETSRGWRLCSHLRALHSGSGKGSRPQLPPGREVAHTGTQLPAFDRLRPFRRLDCVPVLLCYSGMADELPSRRSGMPMPCGAASSRSMAFSSGKPSEASVESNLMPSQWRTAHPSA